MSGKVLLNGKMIGLADTSATERANEASAALFEWAWRYRNAVDDLNRATERQIEEAARRVR